METDKKINIYDSVNHYSLVFYPDERVRAIIRSMKTELKLTSGKRFGSENSEAHLTICEFLANDKQLQMLKVRVAHFCRYFKPFDAMFKEINFFTHSKDFTLYLAADGDSRLQFENMMKKINSGFPLKDVQKNTNPHLTIGRHLDYEQLEIAIDKWGKREFDIRFLCDKIVLRKLDSRIGQLFVTDSFIFKGVEEWTLL